MCNGIIEHSEDNIFHPVAAIVCHGSNNNLDWVNLHLHLYHSREPDSFLGYLKTSFVRNWGPLSLNVASRVKQSHQGLMCFNIVQVFTLTMWPDLLNSGTSLTWERNCERLVRSIQLSGSWWSTRIDSWYVCLVWHEILLCMILTDISVSSPIMEQAFLWS